MNRSALRLTGLVVLALGGALLWGEFEPEVTRYARTVYDTAGLDVERAGWDTLRARPRFVRRTSLGAPRPAEPAATRVLVLGADYDTLYAGPGGGAIPIPDRRLADREPLLVEACGAFRKSGAHGTVRTLCQQATVRASPKRVHAEELGVTFPEGEDFRRGRYDMRLRVERRAFEAGHANEGSLADSTAWEALPDQVPESVLLARTESAGGQAVVRVPVDSVGHGAFDLARYDGYDDFRYHLRAAMERPRRVALRGAEAAPPSAVVAFEVQARMPGGAAPQQLVSSVRKEVRRLTEDERRQRVQRFAYSAAREVARRLHGDQGAGDFGEAWRSPRTRVAVEGWSYDRINERYEADLRVRWFTGGAPNGRGFSARHVVEGTLMVEAGSREARFTGERGNDRAVRRWRRAVPDGETLSLGTLAEPGEEADLPAVAEQDAPRDDAAARQGDEQRAPREARRRRVRGTSRNRRRHSSSGH